MRNLFLAAAVASASVLSAGSVSAAPVSFYMGTTDNQLYTPSCAAPSGYPKVSHCESHGLKMDVKGHTVDQSTYTPGRQLHTKSLGHNGLGVKAGWWDLDPKIDGNWLTPDESMVLHFHHEVRLTKLGFSHVGKHDKVMVGVLKDMSSAASGYEYHLQSDGKGANGQDNGHSPWKWLSWSGEDKNMLRGTSFLVSTTNKWDSYGLKHVHAEKVPLPAAGWMLIAAVGGLAAMKRRARNAT